MKCTTPSLLKNSNSIFQKNAFSVFNSMPNQLISNVSNNFSTLPILPIQNNFYFNKYQNLYNQILSKDKIASNTFPNNKKNIIKYIPTLSEIKIILNEDSNVQKINNNNLDNNGDKNINNINNNLLLGKKRKKEKIYEITKVSNPKNESSIKQNKKGRKKKKEIFKGNHTKHTADNIIRKIKCHFFNYINNNLNKNLVDKKQVFYKLDNFVNENLKKDYNIKLMNSTIKDIYLTSNISNKYKKCGNDINKKLIEKIYLNNNETEVIKILNKTYIETYNDLIENNLDNFCNLIVKKDEKNGLSQTEAIDYLKKIKQLCLNYESWFMEKKGRREKVKISTFNVQKKN